MAESVREFFQSIESRVDPSKTAGASASYRFDIEGAGSWHIDVDDGKVTVAESGADADCVIQASEEHFAKIIGGEANPMTAYMTGKLKVKGDVELALKLKDFFF
jgi:putative sterol carrier protein